MKTAGLITEYNPFHNGHLYHISKTRELTGADYLVVIMSGDFVQRGAPAVYDKYTRTVMALKAGADLVLELPSIYAVSSAEDFAACGAALLDKLGVIDFLCFGSEAGDIQPLSAIADILIQEPEKYTAELKNQLKTGCTFPEARKSAVASCLLPSDSAVCAALLDSPNNILGIEYLKALKRRNSAITPITITRAGNGYHDPSLSGPLSSASAIRSYLLSPSGSDPDHSALINIRAAVPDYVYESIRIRCPIALNDFSDLLNYTLLSLEYQNIPLSEYADFSDDLTFRMKRTSLEFPSFEERIAQLKTRQYTYTRISRALLHLILQIKTEDILRYRSRDYVPYARVLGFRKASSEIMKQIKHHGSIPLITKVANANQILPESALPLFKKDLYCSHLYQSILQRKTGLHQKNEYTQGCCIL